MNSQPIPKGVVRGLKVRDRVRASAHPAIGERLRRIEKLPYEVFVHEIDTLDHSAPIFTIVLTLHEAKPEYVTRSIRSVEEQSYKNVELVIVNNGATGKAGELAWAAFTANKRAKYLGVEKNLYDPSLPDLDDPIPNLWNAGLFASVGDFVYFLSYDDFLSADYCERMVALFLGDGRCCTAAPSVLSVDELGNVQPEVTQRLADGNRRGRYTEGVELARDYMRGGNRILFPGGLLAVKSDLVLSAGGFDNLNDLGQLFKFAVHGTSGFDPEAKLYWRHHADQTNKHQKTLGLLYYRNIQTYSETYGLRETHLALGGADFAAEFERFMDGKARESAIGSFQDSIDYGFVAGMRALARLVRECPPAVTAKAIGVVAAAVPKKLYARFAPRPVRHAYRAVRDMVWRTSR